jgi:hypothetical protein
MGQVLRSLTEQLANWDIYRCAGGLTVETTSWEKLQDDKSKDGSRTSDEKNKGGKKG